MLTETQKLIERVTTELAISDYRLARLLNVTPQRVSNWRTGNASLNDDMAVRIAGLLEESPAYVLALVNAERTTNAVARSAFKEIAQKFKGAAAIMAALLLAGHPGKQAVSAEVRASDHVGDLYIMCSVCMAAR